MLLLGPMALGREEEHSLESATQMMLTRVIECPALVRNNSGGQAMFGRAGFINAHKDALLKCARVDSKRHAAPTRPLSLPPIWSGLGYLLCGATFECGFPVDSHSPNRRLQHCERNATDIARVLCNGAQQEKHEMRHKMCCLDERRLTKVANSIQTCGRGADLQLHASWTRANIVAIFYSKTFQVPFAREVAKLLNVHQIQKFQLQPCPNRSWLNQTTSPYWCPSSLGNHECQPLNVP